MFYLRMYYWVYIIQWFTLILSSVFLYGGRTYKSHLNDILVLQKKLVRIITNSDYLAHTDPLFHSTGILKINELYEYHLTLYAFRNKNNFVSSSHAYQTRQSHHAVPAFSRLSVYQRSLFHAVPPIFNSLPQDIKTCSNLQSFKKAVKNRLLSRYVLQLIYRSSVWFM